MENTRNGKQAKMQKIPTTLDFTLDPTVLG